MSTDRQTRPWTRSACTTTSAPWDQVSAPGDLIRALLTSIQSAQLSSDLDTIVAAPDGSCVPAPLSSVCSMARRDRANRPNRPLGRAAGDGCGIAAVQSASVAAAAVEAGQLPELLVDCPAG